MQDPAVARASGALFKRHRIRLVRGRAFEPLESIFWSLKALDIPPSIYRNGFRKSFRVTKRHMGNIGKPGYNSMFTDNPVSCSRYEVAVAEALHVRGLSHYVPDIEQYFLSLILDNSPKHFKEGLFGSL